MDVGGEWGVNWGVGVWGWEREERKTGNDMWGMENTDWLLME